MSKNDWLNHVVEIYFGYVLEEYKFVAVILGGKGKWRLKN